MIKSGIKYCSDMKILITINRGAKVGVGWGGGGRNAPMNFERFF